MKHSSLLFFFIVTTLFGTAQNGRVLESLEFTSSKVDYPVNYSIYLPPDYDSSQRSYPVVYLLHGYSDDETGWIQFGEANRIMDEGISGGEVPSSIIVMPDGKVSWYINSFDGKDPWEDMFIQEFIPFIESQYRIRSKKEFRAIAGLSMGGNGALLLSIRNPQLFSTCVALSSAVFTDEEKTSGGIDHYFGNIFGPAPGKGRVSEHWKSYNVLHLLEKLNIEDLKTVRYYIDCGDDDFLYSGNAGLHVKMRDMQIPHEFRIRNGGHQWSYWRSGLVEGLKFIGEKFHR